MALEDKIDGAKDQVAGKAKEVEGKVTGDETREVEGKVQGLLGKAAAEDVVEDIKEKFDK